METKSNLGEILKDLPKQNQRQDSLSDQLRDLQAVANHLGMYDAADFIREISVNPTSGLDQSINKLFDVRP